MTRITRNTFLALLAGLALGGPLTASAQGDWPAGRPINWVVPYPPGGTTDVLGRALGQQLAQGLSATVLVENRAGATGTIGSAYVAKAAPDGYTLLGTSIGPQAIAPHLMRLSYDPLKDLEPVMTVGTVPHVLVVGASQPFKTVAELVKGAREKPGQLAYASGGKGTILHMQGELLRQQAGVPLIHVPYKGDVPALQDTLGGQVNFMFAPVTAALPHIQSGRLRALAVTSGVRLKQLPGVPTMGEAGFKGFVVEQWQAVYLPAKTPRPVVERLNQALNQALHQPAVRELADKLGVTLVGGSPVDLAQRQRIDSQTWAEVIRKGGIKADQ